MIEISIDSLIEPVDPQRTVISSEGIEELARSIERVGIISPITVIPRGEKYEVVAGHRRYLAAKMTHLAIIPCIVMYPGEVDETETKIHENLYRENINSADEAEFYEKLITLKGLSIHEIAEKTGKSASYIRGRLDLLEGDPLVMEALRDDQINISVAQELNKIDAPTTRRTYLMEAISKGISLGMVKTWRYNWERDEKTKEFLASGGTQEELPVVLSKYYYSCPLCKSSVEAVNTMALSLCTECYHYLQAEIQKKV